MAGPRVDQLTDQQAIRVLQLVLQLDRGLRGADQLDEVDAQLREAVHQPIDTGVVDDAADAGSDRLAVGAGGPVTPGDLARDTLAYLVVARPDRTGVIDQAIAISAHHADPFNATPRVEPVTVDVGGLIVLALQTDLYIERGTNGKWQFKIHKKTTSDTILGALLGKLMTSYTSGAAT